MSAQMTDIVTTIANAGLIDYDGSMTAGYKWNSGAGGDELRVFLESGQSVVRGLAGLNWPDGALYTLIVRHDGIRLWASILQGGVALAATSSSRTQAAVAGGIVKVLQDGGAAFSYALLSDGDIVDADIAKYGDGLWVPGAIAHEQGGLIAGLRLPASVSHGDVLTSGDVIVDGTTGGTYDVTVGANGGRIFAVRDTP